MKLLQKNWIVVAAAAILIIIAGFFVSINSPKKGELGPASTTSREQVKKIKASVVINSKVSQNKLLSAQEVGIEEGKTALDLTKKVAKVQTKGEGRDAFVVSIDGKIADSAKKEFWEFLVNGKPAEVGAGSYKLKDGDKIEWRISNY